MPDQPDRLFIELQAALAGRYSLERELGRGGMGVVYLAREVRLDRPVAIKLLPPSKTSDPKLRERFLREARTAAKLSSEHHPDSRGRRDRRIRVLRDGVHRGRDADRAGA